MRQLRLGLNKASSKRLSICAGFAYTGILAGSVLGLYEAVLLYSGPHYTGLARPDLGPAIFLAAPLADLLVFGFVGLLLGRISEKRSFRSESGMRRLCATGLGLAGGFAWGVSFLRFWWDKYPRLPILAFVVIAAGLGVSVLSASVLQVWDHRRAGFSTSGSERWVSGLRAGAVTIVVVLLGSVAVYEVRGSEYYSHRPAHLTDAGYRPNIVLIALDTAVGDHFSCYGYSRPTTPNLDRLARRGVQFENAIAPSSWTLPSFASMFTGLLPHQHGADSTSPLPDHLPTLAMALKSAGYQTVGFNANPGYGQASQGIARGFDLYEDGAENLRQNFTRTLFGRAFSRFVYTRFLRPDMPERQDTEEINQKVFRWFRHRTQQPYFLFINYFDVHGPYFAPRPFAKRFGELTHDVWRAYGERNAAGSLSLSQEARASLVAGYDDTLAYADSQVDALMQFLAKSPDWSNTVVIITSDHGEALGEHGHVGHAWGLLRELVHVPLIIFGPGIPEGLRVRDVVSTRRLHATILGFAEGSTEGSSGLLSLQRYWSGRQDPISMPVAVVSALNLLTSDPGWPNAYISLITPEWHCILDAHGHTQLFDWVNDPLEKADLASSSEGSAVAQSLQRTLRSRVLDSFGPWAGLDYLKPLGLVNPRLGNAASPRGIPAARLKPQDRDLLGSLPYQ